MLLVAVIDQRVEPVHASRNDAAATATIATIRPAAGHMSFPPETDTARPAIAALDIYFCLIKELHECDLS